MHGYLCHRPARLQKSCESWQDKRLQRNSSGVNTHRVYSQSATVLLVRGRIYICGKTDEDSISIQNSIIAIWCYPGLRPSLHPSSIINDFLEQKSRIVKIIMLMWALGVAFRSAGDVLQSIRGLIKFLFSTTPMISAIEMSYLGKSRLNWAFFWCRRYKRYAGLVSTCSIAWWGSRLCLYSRSGWWYRRCFRTATLLQ